MTSLRESVLRKVARLNTFKRGGRAAPHKPLLLLIAIGALIHGKRRLPFAEVEAKLTPLLRAFAPPVVGRHQPELPYWHLISDGLWKVQGADALPRQAGGFPRTSVLLRTTGQLEDDIAAVVVADPVATEMIVERLLDEFFPPTIHEDIMAAVGIERPSPDVAREATHEAPSIRYRNPKFREDVLRAYEHHCADIGALRPGSEPRWAARTLVAKLHMCGGTPTTVRTK